VITDVAIMVAALAVATVLALLVGAPNTGTALTFGQLAFAAAATYVIARRR
jgi:hypothetical protein